MLKTAVLAALVVVTFSVNADARPRSSIGCTETGTVMHPVCMNNNFLAGIRSINVTMTRDRKTVRKVSPRSGGIVSPLAAKVAEIQSSCGSRIVSAVRHTRIAGTRRLSLHASGKAVDMQGNPRCLYAHLAGWSGGYSTDYGRVRHVHISYDPDGGREMGLRFRHGSHRYARHRHHRYASAR